MKANQPTGGGESVWGTVSTTRGDGGSWTRAQFRDLPLIERVRLLASGELRFFLAAKQVASLDALKHL